MLAHNSSNETQFYPNGQLISSTGKNNFYLPVSEHDHKVNCNFPNTNHSILSICLCFWLVFNLQLHTGPHLLLGVPENKLRAEDGDHADSCCGL